MCDDSQRPLDQKHSLRMQRLTHRRKPLLRHHMINVVWVQLDGVERVRDWTDWLVDEANHLFVFG